MEDDLPVWLTLEFLNQCISSEDMYKGLEVKGFHTSPVVEDGQNFGSKIKRVTLSCRRGDGGDECVTVPLIMKFPLAGKTMADLFDNSRESWFYYEFFPLARQILKRNFAPKCLTSPEKSVVVLEDLKDLGYSMVDRQKQLDFEHCKWYLAAAAEFHAVSFVAKERSPDTFKLNLSHPLFNKDSESSLLSRHISIYSLECFADRVSKLQDRKEVGDRLKQHVKPFWDALIKACQPSESFNCLNQFDPWSANMMFKYDAQGGVVDIRLIDFQNLILGSPASDLVFFIWSSTTDDVRRNQLDDLYRIYFEALQENLFKLNYPTRMTFDDFMEDVRRARPIALFFTVAFLPLVLSSGTPDLATVFMGANQSGLSLSDNPYRKYYNPDFCHKHLPQLVDQLELAGVLDYITDK